jgi:hypothetical protein
MEFLLARFGIALSLDTSRAGEMQTDSPVRRDATAPLVGSDELAEGLMLVRESTLKIIRFQLAMERRDRRVALEAVDDLVALERRLHDYLVDVPAPELEVERAALNQEKLILGAGVIRAAPKAIEPDPQPLAEMPDDFALVPEHPHRATWWLVAVLVLLSAAAAAGYWIAGPNVLGKIAEMAT